MKINRSFMALAAGLVLVLTSGMTRAAPMTWVDDTLNVQFLSPNLQTVFYNNNFTVPTANASIIPPTTTTSLSHILTLNIEPTSLSLIFAGASPLFVTDAPTTFKVTDLTAPRILNAMLHSTNVVPLPSMIISGDNFFQIDLTSATFGSAGNSSVTVDVSFMDPIGIGTPVPEPASLPLLGFGLLSLAAVLWTKRWQANR